MNTILFRDTKLMKQGVLGDKKENTNVMGFVGAKKRVNKHRKMESPVTTSRVIGGLL